MAVRKRNPVYQKLDLINGSYDRRQARLIQKVIADIMALYDSKAVEIAYLYSGRKLIGGRYLPKDIRETILRIGKTIKSRAEEIIINSIRVTYLNSENKNNDIEKLTLTSGRRRPPGTVASVAIAGPYGNKNGLDTAVKAFIRRKDKQGMNLSSRVWKLSNVWKSEITKGLIKGLNEGTAAKSLGKNFVAALRNKSEIQNPGAGVYRSPQKNARRMVSNVINLAYAEADNTRWNKIETIIGYEVNLSNRHPKYDMCDHLKGQYPKSFVFTPWHVNCLCKARPLLAPQEVRDAIMDYKLGIIDKAPKVQQINDIPEAAAKWIKSNNDRVKGWKSVPFWYDTNRSTVNNIVK